jgi:glucan phosphoethanolaminetransferase (alkaline phosphatase superfamily)
VNNKRSGGFFVCFLLLILLVALSDFIYFIINPPHTDAIFRILTCFSAFLVPLYFFRNYLRLYAWLLLPIFLLMPFSICAIVFFNLPLNSQVVLSVVNTTKQEAMELIHRYLWLFILVIAGILAVFFLLVRKVPSKISGKLSLQISVCSLLVFLVAPVFDKNPETIHRGYVTRIKANLYETFPFSVAYCSSLVYHQFHLIKTSEKERNNFKFNAVQTPLPSSGKQIYLLILGETGRADHWALYGYNRMTSPHIDKRENLISFSDAVAGASFTEFAVPQIITCVTPETFEDHFKQKSIISVFKEAGFKTYWITDQVDYAHIKIHEAEADNVYYEMHLPSEKVQMENTDMGLLSVLTKVLDEPGDKKFIVLHTWGSHFDYSERYPDNYDVFKPSLKTVFARPSDFTKKDVLINSYDNSILFTDAVVDSAISIVKNKTAVSAVYYLADHGENLFDDSNHISLHEEVYPTVYTSHIPFFIWYSDSLKNIFPEKIEWLMKHKNNKIGVEDVIHTVTDVSNVHFPLQDSAKCIDRSSFINSKQHILSEGYAIYTYDSLRKK